MKIFAGEILLINPNQMKPPVTPVAIDFLASMLRSGGYAVEFLDLAFENDVDSALEQKIDDRFMFIGISLRNIDDSFFATRDFCLARIRPIVKKIRRLTAAPIIIGGVGYSIFPVAALEYSGADYGIYGDGELSIIQFADAMAGKSSLANIPGLVAKSNGRCFRNQSHAVDLSALELSDRSTVDNVRYFREGGMVGFETKRGCNASCSYCADRPAKGKITRRRAPEQVAREIEALIDKGIDHFQTCDSEFNIPYDHAVDVCHEFIRRGLGEKARWYAYMAPGRFDKTLASLMKRAGCVGINFGTDHCNPEILRVLGRTHIADSISEASILCHNHEIICMFDLLLGAPGETPETLREVIEFMKSINPSCVGASMGIRLYPGTPMARALASQMEQNAPGFHGLEPDNTELLRPVYYLSPELGENPQQLLVDLVGNDQRFFTASPQREPGDFNYNDNSMLSEAIRAGARGTFWDILRRLMTAEICI